MNARITFAGNPWPEGHDATLAIQWVGKPGASGLLIQLESANYYAERDIPDDPDQDFPDDWQAPIVWGNYHRASFDGWIRLADDVTGLADLDGRTVTADHDKVGTTDWDWDDLAFDHCYILGHDAIAGHTLTFRREGQQLHVRWTGKVAQAYVGKRAFEHDFTVVGTVPLA